ncbi:hypothetical protein ACFX1T_046299 [Malus domestica]|uniref:Uncharacterized protein n=1 Tax=Malus domestica TaxID=3750 RepID=A0A498IZV7_MALDO|nr:hypothetical protein DVH24_000417 [Malus domestica]
MQLVIQLITPTEVEKNARYLKNIFEEVQPSTKATSQCEYKAFEDVDDDSEVTPSSKVKGKAKTGHQGKRVLPSTSNSADYELVPRREFDEFT